MWLWKTPPPVSAWLRSCSFLRKSTALRVIDHPDGQSLGTVMKQEKCVCGVNGGYFDTEFKPIGLRITDGTIFAPLRRASLITGILLQSDRGIDVLRVSEFSRQKKSSPQSNLVHFLSKETSDSRPE